MIFLDGADATDLHEQTTLPEVLFAGDLFRKEYRLLSGFLHALLQIRPDCWPRIARNLMGGEPKLPCPKSDRYRIHCVIQLTLRLFAHTCFNPCLSSDICDDTWLGGFDGQDEGSAPQRESCRVAGRIEALGKPRELEPSYYGIPGLS